MQIPLPLCLVLKIKVDGLMADFDGRIQKLADFAKRQNSHCRYVWQAEASMY